MEYYNPSLVSDGCFDDAIEYYYSLMRKEGFLPNNFSFPFVSKACTGHFDLQLGVKMHTFVVIASCDWFVCT